MAAKKKTVEVQAEEVTTNGPHLASFKEKTLLTPLSIDLGREDLNTVVKKVNEIIDFLSQSK